MSSILPVGLVLGVAVFAGGWAAAVLATEPRGAEPSQTRFVIAEARKGAVGSAVRVTALAAWETTFKAGNQAIGTVTSVEVQAGQSVESGDNLYTVDLRPVRVAVGQTPSFRDLKAGDVGPDVRQLLTLLRDLGYYRGSSDQTFGPQAAKAVASYQSQNRLPVDGVFRRGDVVYVPLLPARVVLNADTIGVGSGLSGGEQGAISVLASAPSFSVAIPATRAQELASGSEVRIEGQADKWVGALGARRTQAKADATDAVFDVQGTSESPMCSPDCASVPFIGETRLSAEVISQPTVHGVVVPTAAMRTTSDGNHFVFDSLGHRRSVEVVASARGLTVIEGLSEGTRIRIGASSEPVREPSS